MGCEVELLVCIATPVGWQRCLWPWRWLKPKTQSLASLFSPSLPLVSGGFLDSGTMTKGSCRLTSLKPHDQRGKRDFLPFPIGKILRRHSDWLSLDHVPFPGPMAVVGEWDIMIGQSLNHMFKPVVRRGGSTERGVLHRQVTPTAISLFSVGRGSVLSPGALGLPVGQGQYPFHWTAGKECGAAGVSSVIHTTLVCQCQSLNPGL